MEKEINSLGSVYVEKSQLLDIVKKNKEKHDIIYSGALEGYNAAINSYLKRVESETERVRNLAIEYAKAESHGKQFDKTGLCLIDCLVPSAPVSYGYDYEKTIKKLELSTADKISLADSEFNQYVMNNWTWKQTFLASNTAYANYTTGCGLSRTNVNQMGQLAYTDRSILISGALSSF